MKRNSDLDESYIMNRTHQALSYTGILILLALFMGVLFLWKQHRQTDALLNKLAQEWAQIKSPSSSSDDQATATDQDTAKTKAIVPINWASLPAKLKDSVVQVFTQAAEFNWLEPYKTPNQGEMYGSAFFINEQGELITNAHVVDQAKAISIQVPSLGKRRLDVDIIAVAPERDLALLRLQTKELEYLKKNLGKVSYLKLGDADKLQRGDMVMTLGYPLGQQFLKSTKGVVSGRQHLQTVIGQQFLIQIDAPINPGNSGGPAINELGEVIGVNSIGAPGAQNVGYIIPSNEISLFERQVRLAKPDPATGIVFLRKPFLGLHYNFASESHTEFLGNPPPGGLYIFQVYKDSPLTKAGIEGGDMLYAIDGYAVDIYGEMNVPWSEDKISLLDYLSRLEWGKKVNLVYYRKGKRKETTLTLEPAKLLPVRRYFPGYEHIDYQVLGGMTLMQLTINHIPLLLTSAPELTRYMEIKNQTESAVIITNLFPDSQAARLHTLLPGTIIKEVNNMEIKTLEDFRKALYKSVDSNFLTIRTANNVFAVLPLRQVLEEEKRLSQNYFYPINPTVQNLIKQLNINNNAGNIEIAGIA